MKRSVFYRATLTGFGTYSWAQPSHMVMYKIACETKRLKRKSEKSPEAALLNVAPSVPLVCSAASSLHHLVFSLMQKILCHSHNSQKWFICSEAPSTVPFNISLREEEVLADKSQRLPLLIGSRTLSREKTPSLPFVAMKMKKGPTCFLFDLFSLVIRHLVTLL